MRILKKLVWIFHCKVLDANFLKSVIFQHVGPGYICSLFLSVCALLLSYIRLFFFFAVVMNSHIPESCLFPDLSFFFGTIYSFIMNNDAKC